MKNIRVLEHKTDVFETLSEAIKFEKELDGVIVIGLLKDGSQMMRSSTMNAMQKSFLVQFLNSWMNRWFAFDD